MNQLNNPKISFVMPCRDRGELIGESIKSIIAQTISEWEMIVIDDHSAKGDNTENIVKSFNDSRIKYFKLSDDHGHGIAAARNFGNQMAEAPIIAVADSDDIFMPERAKLSIEAINNGADYVYGDVKILESSTGKLRPSKPENQPRDFDLEYFKKNNFIFHSTVAVRRQLALDFPHNSFFRRAGDFDFHARIAFYGFKMKFIDKTLAIYRSHPGCISKEEREIGFPYAKIAIENRSWK